MRTINILYFSANDRVNAVDVSIENCPTEDMGGGGGFSNPLQGSKFRWFRSVILGKSGRTNHHRQGLCWIPSTETELTS